MNTKMNLMIFAIVGGLLMVSCHNHWADNVDRTSDAICQMMKLKKEYSETQDDSIRKKLHQTEKKVQDLQDEMKMKYVDDEYAKFREDVEEKLQDCREDK